MEIVFVRRVGVVVITPASGPKGVRFEPRQRHYFGTCNLGQVTHSHCLAPMIRRSFIDLWSVNKDIYFTFKDYIIVFFQRSLIYQ